MQTKEIAKRIILFKFDNQYETTSSIMRLSEYYESPMRKINGYYFTHEYFFDRYAKKFGNMTYFSDWGGFNIPWYEAEAFVRNFKGKSDLWKKEKTIIKEIEKIEYKKYYIIAIHDLDDLKHELCHAYYKLYPQFRKKSNELLRKYKKECILLGSGLLESGYSKKVLRDELNAYLSTSTKAYIKSQYKINIDIPKEMRKNFNDIDKKKRLIWDV